MRISTEKGGKFAENRTLTDVNRRYFGLMADFLRLIDVNAGGLRLEKGQGILHLTISLSLSLSLFLTLSVRQAAQHDRAAANHLRDFERLTAVAREDLCLIKGDKPTPKTTHPIPHLTSSYTHPNKKSLRKQFSGLFVQTVLSFFFFFKLSKRYAERVWANCLPKLFSVGFIGVGGFWGWVFLP